MFKRFSLFLASLLLGLLLLILVVVTSLSVMLRPAPVKTALQHSGIYAKIVPALISNSPGSAVVGTVPSSDTVMQTAAEQAFTPQVVQQASESIIDGTFHWLSGKVPQPDFSVDLTQPRTVFADNVGKSFQDRYNALPLCAPYTLPTTTDPTAIDCRPSANYDITPQITEIVNQIKAENIFIPVSVITPNNLRSVADNGSSQPLFTTNSRLPKLYHWLMLAPFIVGGLILIDMLVLVFVSVTKRNGLRRVSLNLLRVAVTVGIGLAVGSYFFHFIRQKIDGTATGNLSSLQSSLFDLAQSAEKSILHTASIVVASYALIGGAILLTLWFKTRREKRMHQTGPALSRSIVPTPAVLPNTRPTPPKPTEVKPTVNPPGPPRVQ